MPPAAAAAALLNVLGIFVGFEVSAAGCCTLHLRSLCPTMQFVINPTSGAAAPCCSLLQKDDDHVFSAVADTDCLLYSWRLDELSHMATSLAPAGEQRQRVQGCVCVAGVDGVEPVAPWLRAAMLAPPPL